MPPIETPNRKLIMLSDRDSHPHHWRRSVPLLATRGDLGLPGSPDVEPEAAAQRLRRHWNIGTGPVRHLVRTM